MLWQNDGEARPAPVRVDDVVDLIFRIDAKILPVDHAYALSRAVLAVLPWLADEPHAGVHAVHPAASGNGWHRPEDAAQGVLHLSHRTPLMLRLPRPRLEAARALSGRVLEIEGYPLTVGEARERPLVAQSTLFARSVLHPAGVDEPTMVDQVIAQLRAMGIAPRKILCGKQHRLRTPGQALHARSLLVADLLPLEALQLQRVGLGEGRALGCGLFIGHKGVAPVHRGED